MPARATWAAVCPGQPPFPVLTVPGHHPSLFQIRSWAGIHHTWLSALRLGLSGCSRTPEPNLCQTLSEGGWHALQRLGSPNGGGLLSCLSTVARVLLTGRCGVSEWLSSVMQSRAQSLAGTLS